tara:strand:+ start:473 stop:787 length:315 start_codon:yes stop_codon:yes gene_type:complete
MVLKIKDILATRKKLADMKLSKANVDKGTFEDTPNILDASCYGQCNIYCDKLLPLPPVREKFDIYNLYDGLPTEDMNAVNRQMALGIIDGQRRRRRIQKRKQRA